MSRIPLTKATGRQIVKARTELGWSQYDLAQKSGTVRSMIKRIEKHEISTVDAKVLEKIQITLSNRPKIRHAPKSTMSSHKSKTLNIPRFTDGEITILKTLPKRKDLSTFEFYKVKISVHLPLRVDVDRLLGSEIIFSNQFGGNKSGRLNVIEDDRPTLKDGDEVTIGIWIP